MDNEIQLISDDSGLAVIGNRSAVECFLDSVGLLPLAQDLSLSRLKSVLGGGAMMMQGISEITANSGMYLKVDKETAQLVKEFGLMETDLPGISYAMLGKPGSISKWLKIENGPRAFATNLAVLSGIAGMMTQVATQQAIAEITAYLATIDEKVDDVLRKQDDAVVAQMVGTGDTIDRAMIIRQNTGGINKTLWSTVAQDHQTIAATQDYALTQLNTIAKKLEQTKIGGLAKITTQAKSEVPKWLAVLARCFQLQDALDMIELDRVLVEEPEGLIAYQRGVKEVREGRRERISGHTTSLLDRIDSAVGTANAKMVWNRNRSKGLIESANDVAIGVHEFHGLVNIESDPRSWEERQLGPAAERGSQMIQGAKDAAPVVTAVTSAAVVSIAVKKKI